MNITSYQVPAERFPFPFCFSSLVFSIEIAALYGVQELKATFPLMCWREAYSTDEYGGCINHTVIAVSCDSERGNGNRLGRNSEASL